MVPSAWCQDIFYDFSITSSVKIHKMGVSWPEAMTLYKLSMQFYFLPPKTPSMVALKEGCG